MATRFHPVLRAGTAAVSIPVLLRAAADNSEVTGKLAADVSAAYWRQGEEATALATLDLAGIDATHSAGGWCAADAGAMPGLYRLDLPDEALAAGADWLVVAVKVAGAHVFFERFNLAEAADDAAEELADIKALLQAATHK